jgi:hypothetical protein
MKTFKSFLEQSETDGHSLYVPYDTPSSEPVAKKFVWVKTDDTKKPKLLRFGNKDKKDSEEPCNEPKDINNKNTTQYWQWKTYFKSGTS